MRVWRLICVVLACLAGAYPAVAEKRALVVGVNAYPNLAADMQLQRAMADAGAVGETLRGLGFQVTALTSGVTQRNFWKSFDAFKAGIEPGDTALLFFSGHGVAIEGANYLIPGDIEAFSPGEELSLTGHAMAEATIIEGLHARAGLDFQGVVHGDAGCPRRFILDQLNRDFRRIFAFMDDFQAWLFHGTPPLLEINVSSAGLMLPGAKFSPAANGCKNWSIPAPASAAQQSSAFVLQNFGLRRKCSWQ